TIPRPFAVWLSPETPSSVAQRGYSTCRTPPASTRPTTTRSGRVEPRTRATNGTGIPSAGARRPPGANRTTTAAPVKGSGFSMPKLIVSMKGDALNRLATTPRDNRGALVIVLDHLHDTNQDEFNTAIDMLADRAYGPTVIARALTDIARDDN